MSKYSYQELNLKKTEFILPSGRKLFGPQQALGSLYKEFLIYDKVFCFYLHQAAKEVFIYKYLKTRKKEIWDKNLPGLMVIVE